MILEGYCKFITDTCSLKKSQQPDGKNNSFQYWKSIIHEPLLPAKLKFFEMVFGKINAFLRDLQTNKPMVPFIVDTWYCWLLILDLVRDFFYFVVLIQQMTAGHNRQMNKRIFGNSSKCFWFCFMVNQKLKEGSVSTSNLLLKNSEQNFWLCFEELKITWIF